ncbi:MAG TPA: GNAT family N-acetyltransferase [Gordonia sp. (in: high G+C Gram-positive bacteria)]|uniref:GNAT family N-acetyltransferase n=1 Tax=unclassified Gordonia (in: high G+C Gram-positive bacteria) TaxID=2657482 RepID=UPI000FB18D25|nr:MULTISPECIES: GNAT family N-acetyltransferase [unclassified Gordonia (in: high G+C Gram-positive bacteria)]RUP40929.1 MAG: N-acetyltransferase [Gordonia sp. (in: high G+C Gram-positive bacteria)]HNP57015.1 GNAT family N-acetyltransferase [Gordonia sp. (in: high G+C Gram-positive bacteria)]HRC50978.1 GNAT family N-acetyltransferase [Gordonia sp. (in: high G+C Gram-positive bacteria)]
MAELRVDHEPSQERYEAFIDEDGTTTSVGYIDYMTEPDTLVLTHTVVHDQFSGRGFAGQLAKYVLDDAAASGKKIVPVCSYIQTYVERHPEYKDLVREQR